MMHNMFATMSPLALLVFSIALLQATTTAFQNPLAQSRFSTAIFRKSDSKWDNLVDEDEDDPNVMIDARPDMKYLPRNVVRQHQNFDALFGAGGTELVRDLYVPEPDQPTKFWFVGKVASISDVKPQQAVARQWALIVEHAGNLRPIELFPHRGKLEIWMAPGDSELDVAYNRPEIVFEQLTRDVEGAEALKSSMVGFQGEVYERGPGMGFHTFRDRDTGLALKPEIQTPETPQAMQDAAAASAAGSEPDVGKAVEDVLYSDPKYRAPNEEELKKLQEALKDNNMNISELYEEQQKRDKETEETEQ